MISLKQLQNKYQTIAIDTNIFLYFFNQNPEFGDKTIPIFELLIEGKIGTAVTSIITLGKVLASNKFDAEALKDIEFHIKKIPNLDLIDVTEDIIKIAAGIKRSYKFKLPDCIQLATAVFSKSRVFITNDSRLKRFKEVKVLLLQEIKV